MMKMSLVACCVMMGLGFAVNAAHAGSWSAGAFDDGAIVYGEQPKEPKGDKGVSSRCAAIVNPTERRKCIQSGN